MRVLSLKITSLLLTVIAATLLHTLAVYACSSNTLICMANHTMLAIHEMSPGKLIHTLDQHKESSWGIISACDQHVCESSVIIELEANTLSLCPEQILYAPETQAWIKASELSVGQHLWSARHGSVIIRNIYTLLGKITHHHICVIPHHNFLFSEDYILAHNMLITLPILTWGTGCITGTSLSAIFLAICSGIFHSFVQKAGQHISSEKKDNEDLKNDCQNPNPLLNSSNSKPPEKPKTPNQEAEEVARGLGFVKTKNCPFDTHNKPVFQKGRTFISPDRDAHKGGYWKVFNSRQGRVGTFDITLTKKIGK